MLGGIAAPMAISAIRYGEPFDRSEAFARSWRDVALMITSARTPGSIRSTAVAMPFLASFRDAWAFCFVAGSRIVAWARLLVSRAACFAVLRSIATCLAVTAASSATCLAVTAASPATCLAVTAASPATCLAWLAVSEATCRACSAACRARFRKLMLPPPSPVRSPQACLIVIRSMMLATSSHLSIVVLEEARRCPST